MIKKIRLGVVFGGMSSENKVSVISANSILKNLNKEKYEIYPIYIDSDGDWWKINLNSEEDLDEQINDKEEIENVEKQSKKQMRKQKMKMKK